MTNEEAKFMLHGYRPNGADAGNEHFAEALAHAKRDPAVREWFEREQAFDRVVTEKLRTITPPEGLRDSILAGTKMSSENAARPRRAWWLQPWSLGLAAAAAAVAIAFTVTLSEPKPRVAKLSGIEPIFQLALADFGGAHGAGVHASALGAFGAWLESDDSKLSANTVPVNLDELREVGCRSINVAGHEVFEVCIKRDSGWYHVFIAPRDAFEPEAIQAKPMSIGCGELIAISWADEKYAYLVSGSTDIATLRGLL